MAATLALPTVAVQAQVGGTEIAGVRRFASPGEATVQVLVLNSQGGSGIFEVGLDTRIDELLIASGMTLAPKSSGEKVTVTVRLYRESGGTRSLVYEALLDDMLTRPGNYPQLEEGDVLAVETVIKQGWFTWQSGLTILTSLTSIASLLFSVLRSR